MAGVFCFIFSARGQAPDDYQINVSPVVLVDTPFEITVTGGMIDTTRMYAVWVDENLYPLAYDAGAEVLQASDVHVAAGGISTIEVVAGGVVIKEAETRAIPGWLSILPPLIAIAVALLFRQVLPALFLGVWLGAWIFYGLSLTGLWQGLLDSTGVYILEALVDSGHASIIIFSLMIGGMVGVISRNGGMHGIVQRIVKWASDAKRGQIAATILGIVIFFDDYANTLIVGNTMRPVTDKLKISREKLAYIVDSTAAPVASLALVTTWIGFEVGLINDALATIGGLNLSGYGVFLESILYRFYPWLALFFVFLIVMTDREFGPMLKAEHRARTTGAVLGPDAQVDEAAAGGKELEPKEDKPRRAVNAILPVCVLVFGTLLFLYTTGASATGPDASLRDIIGAADSYQALMWGSLLSALTAIVLSVGQRILTLEESMGAWYAGLKSMLFAMLVLILAWALSATTEVLHTAEFLGAALSEALPPGLVPAIIFVLAALIAFATGTSWGTMGILMPLVVPLTWQVMLAEGIADPAHYYLLFNAVSCVLAGAVWGDHCSPISDTTILSSMASGCDHIAHVNTQLPYALAAGLVGLILGTIPTGFGFPWWISLFVSAGVLVAILRFFGRPVGVQT